jgi:hypothetical protein
MDSAYFLMLGLSAVVNYLHYYSPILLLIISFTAVHYLILITLVNYGYNHPPSTHKSSETLAFYLAVKNHDALIKMMMLHCRGGVESCKW